MKTKTDLYTKIVLTVIAIALTANLIKDIDFVSKAQAGEVVNLNAEKAENMEETTFYIYENDKLLGGFGSKEYARKRWDYSSPSMDRKDVNKAYIEEGYDFPKYIITNKKGTFWIEK